MALWLCYGSQSMHTPAIPDAISRELLAIAHTAPLLVFLFDQALLAEGGMPDDPAAYVKRVNALLV